MKIFNNFLVLIRIIEIVFKLKFLNYFFPTLRNCRQ